jgi:ATP-dependent Clp protease protease subunit
MNNNKYWGRNYKSNLEVGIQEPDKTMKEAQTMQYNSDSPMQMPQVVEVVENRIYFYADVDRENVLKLNKTLDALNNDLLYKAKVQNHTPPPIYLYINSYGGHIFDAFSALDSIEYSTIPVHTIIDGCAASAATFLSIFGKRRYIKPHSYFLIHQLSSMMWGKYEEFKDEMENLTKFMAVIQKMYKEKTKLPPAKLNEILKHDLWFDADDALRFGLVDEILYSGGKQIGKKDNKN